LKYIVELQTELTIQEYMQENIFSPLRMNNTGFNASDYIGHHAIPYTRTAGNATNKELPVWNGQYMVRSTARDMGNLLIALMNSGQFGRFQMLQQDTLAMMFQNTCPRGLPKVLRKEFKWEGYGLGLEVRNHGAFGHGGSTVGFTAEMYFNPTTDLGFVRLSNVNAILDSSSTEWESNNQVHYEIRTLIMTDIGMLPTFDTLTVILVVVSSLCVVSIVYSVWRMRRK
jgi:CubicO group peptidase (beta-lactamase class C family)